ncbi:class I SAM-dependent methyltransferase [Microbacterium sp. P04]|uniref:class I SAM-dependent methyltransferase n=1 Tax=Microbacterium sp. P04 TaxID=3366947 RepID=UPI0037463556
MAEREEMARVFGTAAATYEAGRPDYPREAVEWMLQPARTADRAPRVADVGAGTGKLTRVAADLGAEIVAVDPDAQMLETFRLHVPGVPTFVGSAEELPLPDCSLDAVIVGQAWHWVQPDAASAEIARVLRPGGVLGLIWNIRDEHIAWVKRLTEVMSLSNAERMLAEGAPPVSAPFAAGEHRTWHWSRPMTRDTLFAMAHSRSYVLTATPEERDRIDLELGRLCDDIGAVGEATVDLPYATEAFRFVRP